MTGFGTAEGVCGGGRIAVSARSVNHRHLQVQCRLPLSLQAMEAPIRDRVRERLQRGHVSIAISWEQEPESRLAFRVDVARAKALQGALQELARELGLDDRLDMAFFARQTDVLVPADGGETPVEPDELLLVVDQALDGLTAARAREGAALRAALERSLALLESHATAVEVRAPLRLDEERERVRARVADILEGRDVPQDRLELEIVLLAEKLDVSEEVVRLRAHIRAAGDALAGTAPCGKRLSFLGQEMLREINTIGSKGADTAIVAAVIEMKIELEKIREQVENLE
ncbi:MAG TPA: YicC/YloC family endoribonuclease [Gemmatimonadales bacterium]|jgi:uncharacterized protein (TIGR00255 family)